MPKTCEKCASFDRSRFLQHSATRDAGMCTKFTEVTFKRDSCKYWIQETDLTDKDIFVPLVDLTKLPPIDQYNLFQ